MVVVCACRLLVVNVAVDVLSVELVVTNDVVGLILVSSFSVNANADDVVVTMVVKLDIRATRMEKEKKYYTMIKTAFRCSCVKTQKEISYLLLLL